MTNRPPARIMPDRTSNRAEKVKEAQSVYQIVRITDKEGVTKADPESQAHQGCIGEAKMEDRKSVV